MPIASIDYLYRSHLHVFATISVSSIYLALVVWSENVSKNWVEESFDQVQVFATYK